MEMEISLLLLDVAPDPVTPVAGVGGLILIVVAVLMFAAAGIVGFVFFLQWLRCRAKVSDHSSEQAPQFQPNSPNQP